MNQIKIEFAIIYFFFMVFAFIYEYKTEKGIKNYSKTQGKISAEWSYYLMAGSYIFIFIGTPIEYLVVKRDINLIITFSGLIVYISGLMIRRWSINTLDNFWSPHIKIIENHKIIKNGPYRYIRHPNYLATILKGLGFSLIPNSFYILFYTLMVFIPIRMIRIHLEEKELMKEFGQEYVDYQKEVFALLPLKRIRRKINGS